LPISVAIVGIVGVPAKYGGFETLAQTLVDAENSDFQLTVFCSKSAYKERPRLYKNARMVYLPFRANGWQSILYDGMALFKSAIGRYDVILILGVSGALFIPLFTSSLRSRIIVNVDGIEWRRDKWGFFTRLFLRQSEAYAVRYSGKIIADNLGIYNHLKKCYNQESLVIPYGAPEFVHQQEGSTSFLKLMPKEYFFSVCRIEPENNIELILEAFSSAKSKNYVIVGNFEDSNFGRQLKKRFQTYANISILEPLYDLHLLNQLRKNCFAYIHGHSAGGTNPSLVEAMALALPIIAFDVDFNRYTLHGTGFYFKNKYSLRSLLEDLSFVELQSASEKIYDVFKKNYTIPKVLGEYWNCFNAIALKNYS
jgi:glycosyltransferase involved in cell wall biosynthesis